MTPRYGLKKRQPLSAPIFLTFSCSRVASSCLRTNIQMSERCDGGMPPSHRSLIWIFVRRHDEATREHENVKKIGADKGCRFLRPYLGVIWADP